MHIFLNGPNAASFFIIILFIYLYVLRKILIIY